MVRYTAAMVKFCWFYNIHSSIYKQLSPKNNRIYLPVFAKCDFSGVKSSYSHHEWRVTF